MFICSFAFFLCVLPSSSFGISDGRVVFTDITETSGIKFKHVFAPDKKYILESLSGGVALFDYDNDGWLDLLVVNGHVYPQLAAAKLKIAYAQRKLFYRNQRNGTFAETAAGEALNEPSVGRGAAFGDLDNDGDVDVVINNLDGAPTILRNDGGNGGADPFPQNTSHDGASLAKNYDVVVVTHNHRLNLFGYIYLGDLLGEEYAASGAAGMLDIAAALAWIRENAEAFGGDPNNIMIWGESGGGAKTSTLVALPAAQGNFHKASIESGATLRLRTKDAATETTLAVLSKIGLDKSRARELLKVPAEQLLEVQRSTPTNRPRGGGALQPISGASFAFSPVVDGHFIPAHPFDPTAPASAVKIPILVGTNKDETIFFMRGTPDVFSLDDAALQKALEPSLGDKTARVLDVYRKNRPGASPTDIYVAITTARMMWNNAITLAERKVAQKGAPVFMYMFAFESEMPAAQGVTYPTKAAHALEIAFKFNHPESVRSQRQERFKAARNMSRALAAFARTSNPPTTKSRTGPPTHWKRARPCFWMRSASWSTIPIEKSGCYGNNLGSPREQSFI